MSIIYRLKRRSCSTLSQIKTHNFSVWKAYQRENFCFSIFFLALFVNNNFINYSLPAWHAPCLILALALFQQTFSQATSRERKHTRTQQSRTQNVCVCVWLTKFASILFMALNGMSSLAWLPCAFDIVYFILFLRFFLLLHFLLRARRYWLFIENEIAFMPCVWESMLIMRTLCTLYSALYSVYGAIMLLKEDTHSERSRSETTLNWTHNRIHTVEVNNFVSLSETWQTDKFHFFSHSYFILFMSLDGRHNKKRITTLLTKFDQYTLSLSLSAAQIGKDSEAKRFGPKCIPIIFII